MSKNKRKNKRKMGTLMGVTVGGPTPGMRFQVDLNAEAHAVVTPTDPHYCAAIYRYNPQLTAIKELVAVFSHCVPREK